MKSLAFRAALCVGVAALFASSGCGPAQSINPVALRQENTQLKTAMRQYQDQLSQARIRAENLDADNEQLHNELALAQEQLARSQQEKTAASSGYVSGNRGGSSSDDEWDDGDGKLYGPATGRRGRGGSDTREVSAQSSGWLPLANISGAEVRRAEGDTVRIRVTDAGLFDPGRATLKPNAASVLDRVAATLRREYPRNLIGVEGHTDADPIRKSKWKDNHELSYERARAVYEYLRTKGGIPSDQLYIAAFGANKPVASNKSSAGKAQNRRVEFVVHPDGGYAENRREPVR